MVVVVVVVVAAAVPDRFQSAIMLFCLDGCNEWLFVNFKSV